MGYYRRPDAPRPDEIEYSIHELERGAAVTLTLTLNPTLALAPNLTLTPSLAPTRTLSLSLTLSPTP